MSGGASGPVKIAPRGSCDASRRLGRRLPASLLVALLGAPLAAGQAPVPLGPGGPEDAVLLGPGECPTFRWSPAADIAHELVLFADPVTPAVAADKPVLRVTLAAGTDRWTPPPGWCPASGEAYAWAVRALDSAAAPWSEPSLFRVEAAPPPPIGELVAALRQQLGDAAGATLRDLVARSNPPAAGGGSAVATTDVATLAARPVRRVPPSATDAVPPHGTTSAASAGGPVALGADHVGTTAFQDLELRAGGGRALLLQPTAGVANIVGGAAENVILHPAIHGVTISGGGDDDTVSLSHHRVTDDWATIGGGEGNVVGDGTFVTTDQAWATVGGGVGNSALRSRSTVGGGSFNTVDNVLATVAGGASNQASGSDSAIGGGVNNQAAGDYSAIPGGWGAVTHLPQIAFASGSFGSGSDHGSAQWSLFVLRGTTSDATPTELTIDGAELTVSGTVALDIAIVGLADDGDAASYAIEAVVEAATCSPAIVGTPVVTALAEDDPAWDVAIGTTAPDQVDVEVTGAAATTIRWVATVRATVVDRGDLGGC